MRAATFATVDPRSHDAQSPMGQHFTEHDERFPTGFERRARGRPGCDASPNGAFVVVRNDAAGVGCGGVQRLDTTTGEVKRM